MAFMGNCCGLFARGPERSDQKPDVGIGTRQGELFSSDAFAIFIDDLESEIERKEEERGYKLGISPVGVGAARGETLATLKQADDNVVVIALSAEDLQILFGVLTTSCQKWQITPNALKCECMFF